MPSVLSIQWITAFSEQQACKIGWHGGRVARVFLLLRSLKATFYLHENDSIFRRVTCAVCAQSPEVEANWMCAVVLRRVDGDIQAPCIQWKIVGIIFLVRPFELCKWPRHAPERTNRKWRKGQQTIVKDGRRTSRRGGKGLWTQGNWFGKYTTISIIMQCANKWLMVSFSIHSAPRLKLVRHKRVREEQAHEGPYIESILHGTQIGSIESFALRWSQLCVCAGGNDRLLNK